MTRAKSGTRNNHSVDCTIAELEAEVDNYPEHVFSATFSQVFVGHCAFYLSTAVSDNLS